MAQIEIRLPKMGESVTEATITNWLKNIGDTIEMDEPLVEVATDKVDNELPSEAEGVLVQQLFDTDEVAQVGDVIAIISTDGDAPADDADTSCESRTTARAKTNQASEPAVYDDKGGYFSEGQRYFTNVWAYNSKRFWY